MTDLQKPNSTSTPSVTYATIKYLFAKLHARYGSKWAAQYPDALLPAVQDEWLKMLQDLTPQQFRRGLDSWCEAWPPNAQEFYNACTHEEKIPPSYHKMLEPPKITKSSMAARNKHMEHIRKYLPGIRNLKEGNDV